MAWYVSALVNIYRWRWLLAWIASAVACSIPVSIITTYLSRRLNEVYFTIGTFAMYLLGLQIAYHRDSLTWGSLGLSGISRLVWWQYEANSLLSFLVVVLGMLLVVMVCIYRFYKSYRFRLLQARWQNEDITHVLGVSTTWDKFIMVAFTSICASICASLQVSYIQFIDPWTFWIGMVLSLLLVVFTTIKSKIWYIPLASLGITFLYEWLRFFKLVQPWQIWYTRELVFGVLIIVWTIFVFRTYRFWRTI
jgi:branched-chain amino acid transport system permease protein